MTTQETLLALMNLPPSKFSGVVLTTDGFYIASVHGDLGYNHFLGKPAPVHDGPGKTQMLSVWNRLTVQERDAVYQLADNPIDGHSIPLHEGFGVPYSIMN